MPHQTSPQTPSQRIFLYLTCPRCACGNRFGSHEMNGPLGIFCKDCGSAFERSMLHRIRDALEHDTYMHKLRAMGIIASLDQKSAMEDMTRETGA